MLQTLIILATSPQTYQAVNIQPLNSIVPQMPQQEGQGLVNTKYIRRSQSNAIKSYIHIVGRAPTILSVVQ